MMGALDETPTPGVTFLSNINPVNTLKLLRTKNDDDDDHNDDDDDDDE